MKVENWGDITCHECRRALTKMPHDTRRKFAEEATFWHPQNTIGSVEYGWPKCSMEGKTIIVPVPLIDARVED